MGRRYIVFTTIWLVLASVACNVGSSSNQDQTGEDIQTAPLVLLLAPVNGSTYANGVRVQLHAIAQDSLAGVSRIEFRVDDKAVGEVKADEPDGQPSLEAQIVWKAKGKQGHLITVEGFRADGSSLGLHDVAVNVTDKPSAEAVAGSTPLSPDASDTGTSPATPVPSPTNVAGTTSGPDDMGILTGPVARVNAASLYVRQGPGTNYPSVGSLAEGDRVQIVGYNAERDWWAVSYGGGTGWVFASLVIVEGDTSQVPLVAAPPP
jgi:uncharacterized protein YgiM (DUF1202 family)